MKRNKGRKGSSNTVGGSLPLMNPTGHFASVATHFARDLKGGRNV